MKKTGAINRIVPAAAIPGGEIAIELRATDSIASPRVLIDGHDAHIIAASGNRVLALVPMQTSGGEVAIAIADGRDSSPSGRMQLKAGTMLARDVHPVANPAFDPNDGTLYVTRSGSRGEHVPVSIYRVNSEDELEEFSGDITNPTGIAFDRSGQMFVTSRFDGTVYRVSPLKECSVFASNLGIATGLAFNQDGDLFVGDRSGTIFKINDIGEASPWAEHEPSVSAYHLAFGPDEALYVTGPTVSSFDGITRFDRLGRSAIFFRGLGRPQGMAFDVDGSLYVAASLRGRRGIVKISPAGSQADLVVAGMNVVGLAFSRQGDMIVATNDSVYSLNMGIKGVLLS
jgi:sugar lactone lactonase YvrE